MYLDNDNNLNVTLKFSKKVSLLKWALPEKLNLAHKFKIEVGDNL